VANNLARFWRWTKGLAETVAIHQRTEITIETERVVVVRRRRLVRFWCHECGCEVEMVNLEDATKIAGMERPLPHAGGAARWHISPDRKWVCLKSLSTSEMERIL
jgi:hypothetical protein